MYISPDTSSNTRIQCDLLEAPLHDAGCLKITEDEVSDVNVADTEVAFQPQKQASCQTRGSRLNPNADLASFVKCGGRVRTSDVNLAFSVKHDGRAVL